MSKWLFEPALDGMLNLTEVELETISDSDMYWKKYGRSIFLYF